jgi:hypothetical protein
MPPCARPGPTLPRNVVVLDNHRDLDQLVIRYLDRYRLVIGDLFDELLGIIRDAFAIRFRQIGAKAHSGTGKSINRSITSRLHSDAKSAATL